MTAAWKRNISSQQVTGLLVHSMLNYWDASQIGGQKRWLHLACFGVLVVNLQRREAPPLKRTGQLSGAALQVAEKFANCKKIIPRGLTPRAFSCSYAATNGVP